MTLTDSQYKTLLDAAVALKLAPFAREENELNAARYGAIAAIERFFAKYQEDLERQGEPAVESPY